MASDTNGHISDESLAIIESSKSKIATRRTFLKGTAAAGAIAAMYAVPKFSSVHARPAYAGVTGGGVRITKTFDSLFPETEFGGDGIIPDVAITDITGLPGGISIRLGLAAHARYSAAPGVTGVAPGVYTASPGSAVPPSGSTINGALWNFDYYVKIDGGTFADCKFCLLYDFDPSGTNSEASLGKIDFNGFIVDEYGAAALAGVTKVEQSENLLFGYLTGPPSALITPPSFLPFSATATGEYRFELIAKTNADVEVGRTSIKVNVVSPPVGP